MGEGDRRDPFGDEPVVELGLGPRPEGGAGGFRGGLEAGNGRRSKVTPSERRRRGRRMGVTFSDPDVADRLRALAHEWGWFAPDGRSPAVSRVVEFLVLDGLERVERGEVGP